MLYNGSTTPTYEAGRSVSDIFERKWVESGIMEQWNNLSSVGQVGGSLSGVLVLFLLNLLILQQHPRAKPAPLLDSSCSST